MKKVLLRAICSICCLAILLSSFSSTANTAFLGVNSPIESPKAVKDATTTRFISSSRIDYNYNNRVAGMSGASAISAAFAKHTKVVYKNNNIGYIEKIVTINGGQPVVTFEAVYSVLSYSIPSNATNITLVAAGGSGGSSQGFLGGRGAILKGSGYDAALAGSTLKLIVGERGKDGNNGAGGGGGTFIMNNATLYPADPLIAAGGGGGAGSTDQTFIDEIFDQGNVIDASLTTSGYYGLSTWDFSGGVLGTDGNAGGNSNNFLTNTPSSSDPQAGGGAGWIPPASNLNDFFVGPFHGNSPNDISGAIGGNAGNPGAGGYGGGGAANLGQNGFGGGGGGGYSGGGGGVFDGNVYGTHGGGGGSYFDSIAGTLTATDFNPDSNGYIEIEYDLPNDCTPPSLITCNSNITNISAGINCTAVVVNYASPVFGGDASNLTYVFAGATLGSGSGTGSGSIFNKGLTVVTITATNSCGTASCTFTVEVVDNTPPVAPVSLPDITGECSATVIEIPTALDACSGVIVGATTDPLTYDSQGTFTITWTFNDGNGNISTAKQNVIVKNVTPPTAVCPSDITTTVNTTNGSGVGGSYVTFSVTATSNCGVPGIVSVPASGSFFPLGETVVTTVVTDVNGLTSTCSFKVIVNCGPPESSEVKVIDNCDGTSTLSTNAVGTLLWSNGANTPSITVNAAGTYSVTSTVNGCVSAAGSGVAAPNTKPVVSVTPSVTGTVCPGSTVTLTATPGYSYQWYRNGVLIPGATSSTYGAVVSGSYTVIATGTGGCEATSNPVIVTVADVTPPEVPVLADVTGQCSATAVTPTTTDNCTGTVTGTTSDPLIYTTQGTHVIHWSFTDGNGNTSTATQNVIVKDVTPPSIVCPSNISTFANTVQTGVSGSFVSFTVTGSDNCGVQSITSVPASGSFFPVGTTIVTSTIVDVNGLTKTCSFNVTVSCNQPMPTISANGPTTFCSGGSVTLTASLAGSYLWSTGETTQSITVSTAGSYTVTATNGTCSAKSLITTVTVNPLPLITGINGNTTVCEGKSFNLSASTNIGSPSFTWYDANNTPLPGNNVSVASANLNTNYSYTVAVTDDKGCTSVRTPVTVTVIPGPPPSVVNQIQNCDGTTTLAVTNINPGSVILFADASITPLVPINGPVITVTGPATYYSVQRDLSTGCQSKDVTVINVLANPKTTPSTPVVSVINNCDGTSTLSTNATGTLLWSNGANTSSITVNASGTYSVTSTINGCVSAAGSGTAAPGTAPIVSISAGGNTTVCPGSTVTLHATTGFGTYQWFKNTVAITDANNADYVATETGNYYVIAANGLCTATSNSISVTVKDVTAPVAPVSLPDVTGECSATVTTVPTAMDACSGVITGTTNDPLTYTTQGTHTIHWTFTDASNNTSTATQNVIVKDVTPPSANCPRDIITTVNTVNVTGVGGSNVTFSVTATDNCGVQSIVSVPASGSFFPVGTTIVTTVVTDVNGLTSTCSFRVIVNCVTPATPNVTVTNNCDGTSTLTTDATGAILWSNGSTNSTITVTTGGTYKVSQTINGCTSLNGSGFAAPNTAPVVSVSASTTRPVCPGSTVVLTATSGYSYQWYKNEVLIPGATSSTYGATVSGNYTVVATGTGGCDATSNSVTVIVADVIPPAVPVLADVVGECSATATVATTTDNCTGTVVGTTSDPLTYTTQGIHVIHWTFTDGTGNTSVATQNVIVKDVTAPSAVCPSDITTTVNTVNVTGVGGSNVTFSVTATDNCGVQSIVSVPASGSFFPVGTTIVTTVVTDVNGLTSTCSFKVIVNCVTPPMPVVNVVNNCDGTATLSTNAAGILHWSTGSSASSITVNAPGTYSVSTIVNGCPSFSNSVSISSIPQAVPAPTVSGATVVCPGKNAQLNASSTIFGAIFNWYDASNTLVGSGNSYSANIAQTYYVVAVANGCVSPKTPVTVSFSTPPPTPVVTLTENCDGTTTLYQVAPVATVLWRNVLTPNNIIAANPFIVSVPGTYETAQQDASGCISQIIQVVVNANTKVTPVATIAAVGGTTACPGSSVILQATTPSSGVSYQWQKNGIDIANANSATYAATTSGSYTVVITNNGCISAPSNAVTVTIEDVTNPVVPVLADVVGECSATATVATTTDNCTGTVVGTTTDALTYTTQGTHVIHWTFTDGNGNESHANQNVIVRDVTAPSAVCPSDITTTVTTTNGSGVGGSNVTFTVTATDNCGVQSIVSVPASGSFFPVGETVVTTVVTDINGLTSTCSFKVIVNCVTPATPVVTVVNNCDGTSTLSTNAVGTLLWSTGSSASSITVNEAGTYSVTSTVNGCVSAAGSNVAAPNTTPVVSVTPSVTGTVCPGSTVILTATPGYTYQWYKNGNLISGATSSTYEATTSGNYSVVATGTGNCSAPSNAVTVTVADVTPPVAPVLANLTGECSVTVTKPTAIDACAGTITGSTTSPLTYTTQGTYTIVWTFNDGNGNSSTSNQKVIVKDVTPPSVKCPDAITTTATTTNGSGVAGATVTYGATTSDNCGVLSTVYSPASGSFFPVGTTVVTTTVTDVNGLTSTCSFNVTVTSNCSPVITVSSTPTSNTYTGGAPNSLFIGYGAQSTTLNVATAAGGTYTYVWSGSAANKLSSTTVKNPVFTPTAAGSYTFTVTVTSSTGCKSTGTITICVTDIRVIGYNPPTSVDPDDNQGMCDHQAHDASDCPHEGHGHSCDHKTHSKYACSHKHEGDDDDDDDEKDCDHKSHVESKCPHKGHNHKACDHKAHSESSCEHNRSVKYGDVKVCDHKAHSYKDCTHEGHNHKYCNHQAHTSSNCPHNGGNGGYCNSDAKVFLCHVPPGNPGKTITLSISVNAVADHLANHPGDRLGSCEQAACTAYVDVTKPEITCPASVNVNCGTSTAPTVTGTATATDNLGYVVVTYSDVTSGNVITRTWKAADAAGNFSTCTQTITLVSPVITVTSVPTSNTFTGGGANSLFIGYGAQSTTLSVAIAPAGSYTYVWSGAATNKLNSTTTQNPVFTPSAAGSYTFTVTATGSNGCKATGTITICVTDIRVIGYTAPTSVDPDDNQGMCDHQAHDASDCPHKGHNHSCDHRTHSKYACGHRDTNDKDDDDQKDCDHKAHSASECSHKGHNHKTCDHKAHSATGCEHDKNVKYNDVRVCDHKSHSEADCSHDGHNHKYCNHQSHSASNCPHNGGNGGNCNSDAKVYLCHVPPGNPGKSITLYISVNAVAAHLANHPGDRLGSCDQQACSSYSDVTKPEITCPSAITINCGTSSAPSVTGSATAIDNLGYVNITYTDVNGAGIITRTWKATDGSGNASTCTQIITLVDNVKPVITDVADKTVACGTSTLPSVTGSATATDNCSTPVVTYLDAVSGNTITRTWKATDAAGNYITSTQIITLTDNVKPVITCPGDKILSGCGASTDPSATGYATATDNCSTPVVTYSDVIGNNGVITRTWKATDASGNYSTCVQSITKPTSSPCVLPYPIVDVNYPRSSVPFNESEILRATDPGPSNTCATTTPTQIKLWYNDEHPLTLGVRQVIVKTSSGITTTNYPVTAYSGVPSTVTNPVFGATAETGDQSGNDVAAYGGRPLRPVLYISDITSDPNNRAGDWQHNGVPYNPNRISGSWKSAVRFVDKTKSPAVVTVMPDADPILKNNWLMGVGGDIAPSGLINEGYGAEVVWNVSSLGLLPGHTYRLQFIVHDGDQNKAGGDAGQACTTICIPANTVVSTVASQSIITKAEPSQASKTIEEELSVSVMPNPSTTFFTLKIESKFETPVSLRVMDGTGRVVDAKSKIGANSTIQIGHNYSSGTYFAELIQGGQRKVVQLIKVKG